MWDWFFLINLGMWHFHSDEKLYIFNKTNNNEVFRLIYFNLQAVPNEELVYRLNTKDVEVPTQLRSQWVCQHLDLLWYR